MALRDFIAGGKANPSFIVSHELPLDQAPEGYKNFDNREDGWTGRPAPGRGLKRGVDGTDVDRWVWIYLPHPQGQQFSFGHPSG